MGIGLFSVFKLSQQLGWVQPDGNIYLDSSNANIKFAYKLDEELKGNSIFATNTGVIGNLVADDKTFKAKTFTVDVVLVPKKSLKL